MKLAFAVLLIVCSTAFAERQAKYPPKTARTLHTDAEIARARENIKKYPAAAAVAQQTIKAADQWVDWKDEDLRALLTGPEVPRAFAVSASGCPICGNTIKSKGGDYAWIIDPKIPNKIKCPVDDTVFPNKEHPWDPLESTCRHASLSIL